MSETSTLEPPVEGGQNDQEVLEQLLLAQEALDARLRPKEITDEQGFGRTEFHITGSEDVAIVFRGREELPTSENNQGAITAVVSPDERPLHTSGDDYGKWLSDLTDEQPFADPFERAAREDAGEVRLIANATPYGVVGASIYLIEMGLVDAAPDRLGNLKHLQKKLRDNVYDEEVYELYDQLYAASAVMVDNGELNSSDSGKPKDGGLMEVVMAMVGDEDAQKLLETKESIVRGLDREMQAKLKQQDSTTEDVDLKQPGDRLTDDELETIAQQHLVGVHTTEAMPYHINEQGDGISVIRPTFSFGDEHERLPRNTIHFSLNHPVESHISGNFDNRGYTVIAPLEDLAKLNGAPAVLYGVDTYFTLNPGSGVFIPETATILDSTTEKDVPGIEVTGNVIRLKSDHLTSEDANEIVDYVLKRYSKELERPYETYNSDKNQERLTVLMESLIDYSPIRGIAQDIFNYHNYGRKESRTEGEAAHFKYVDAMHKLLTETLIESGNYPEITDFVDYPTHDYNGRQEVIRQTIERLYTEESLIEQYPELQTVLSEAMRQTIVKLEIQKMGGESVISDNQSAFIETNGFDKKVNATAKSLGIRIGLHVYQPEIGLERAYGRLMTEATKFIEAPRIVDGKQQGTEIQRADFDWQKYSIEARRTWAYMASLPVPSRRMAIAMGLMSHARPAPVNEDNWMPG